MFITHNAFRLPHSALLGDPARVLWGAIEIDLERPWFMLNLIQVDLNDGGYTPALSKTFLLPLMKDVLQVVNSDDEERLHFESVFLVTPSDMNSSGGWKMESLRAVWTAEDPAEPGIPVEVYETDDGGEYPQWLLKKPVAELLNKRMKFDFSIHRHSKSDGTD